MIEFLFDRWFEKYILFSLANSSCNLVEGPALLYQHYWFVNNYKLGRSFYSFNNMNQTNDCSASSLLKCPKPEKF